MAIKLEFASVEAKKLYIRTPNRFLFRKRLFRLRRTGSYLIRVSDVLGKRLLAVDKSNTKFAFQIN